MIEEQEGLLEQTIWSPLHRRSSTWCCTCIPNKGYTATRFGDVEGGIGALYLTSPSLLNSFKIRKLLYDIHNLIGRDAAQREES